jgi:hypothetical protein
MGDCRKPGCTATRTATPTNDSNIEQYVVKNEPRKEARGAHRRTPANKPRRIPYALPPQLCAHPSFRLVPFFPACFPGLSSLQDGSGCPVDAAHDGFSASYPGTLHLMSRSIPSAPALLVVWQSGASPLLNKSTTAMPLSQRPCLYGWTIDSPSERVSDLLFRRVRLATEDIQAKQ